VRVKVFDPIGSVEHQVRALARRPEGLAGRRIGILDNSKPNADVLLGRVAELLVARTGGRAARWWRKPGSSRAATMIEDVVAGSDVVLTGSAD
jgi:hypothetical protein